MTDRAAHGWWTSMVRIAASTTAVAAMATAHTEERAPSQEPDVQRLARAPADRVSPAEPVRDVVGLNEQVAAVLRDRGSNPAPAERGPLGALDPVKYFIEEAGPELLKLSGPKGKPGVQRHDDSADRATVEGLRGARDPQNLRKRPQDLHRTRRAENPEAFPPRSSRGR